MFRPEALWSKCLVGLSVLLFAAAGVTYFVEVTGNNPRRAAEMVGVNPVNTAPIAFAYFWTTVESLSFYRRPRLRLRPGLTEAVVVNRVLLWGLMALAPGIAVIISLAGILAGSFMSAPLILVFSCLGSVQTGCLFLAFHPPGWYRGWLEGRAPAVGS